MSLPFFALTAQEAGVTASSVSRAAVASDRQADFLFLAKRKKALKSPAPDGVGRMGAGCARPAAAQCSDFLARGARERRCWTSFFWGVSPRSSSS